MTSGTVYDRRLYWKSLWRRRSHPYGLNMVPTIVDYDREGKIGKFVLELGCSCNPVTNWLNLSQHRRILLDVSSEVHTLATMNDTPLAIECDLCEFNHDSNDYKTFQKTLDKYGINRFNAIIAADNLLNYIPWRSVFTNLNPYLLNSGLLFLCFGIGVGRGEAFHKERPDSSRQVFHFFVDNLGYRLLEYGTQKDCHGYVLKKPDLP